MLQVEELTVGAQDPDDLAQGELGIVDGAQHERRHDRVDRSVGKRQLLRRRLDESCVPAAPAQALLEADLHRAVRFGEDELVDVVGVVRQVEAGAAPDLHGASARPTEKLPAQCTDAGPLADPARTGRRRAAKARAQAVGLCSGVDCSMAVCTRAMMRDARPRRIASVGHSIRMARSGDGRQSRPSRAASATAAVRVRPPELVADVRDVAVHRVSAHDQLLGDLLVAQAAARPTPTPRVPEPESSTAGASPVGRAGSLGRERGTQGARHRVPNRRPTGSGRSRRAGPASPPGIPAASSRPSRYGIARSSRRCTTSVGARTRPSSDRTSLR